MVLIIFLFQSLKSKYRVAPAATSTPKEIKPTLRSRTGRSIRTGRSKSVKRAKSRIAPSASAYEPLPAEYQYQDQYQSLQYAPTPATTYFNQPPPASSYYPAPTMYPSFPQSAQFAPAPSSFNYAYQ